MPKKKNKSIASQYARSFFLKPVTPKKARKEARARANTIYGPEIRDLSKEQKSYGQKARQTRGAYRNYRKDLKGAAKTANVAYDRAADSISSAVAGTNTYAESLRNRMIADSKADAANRGAAYDPTASNLAQAANLARAQSGNTLSAVLRTQGAAQAGYMADKAANARLAQRNAVLAVQGQKAQAGADKRYLKRQRGEYVAGEMSKAREADRNFFIQMRASAQPGKARRFEARQAALARAHDSAEAKKARRHANRQNKKTGGEGRQDFRQDVRQGTGHVRNTIDQWRDAHPKKVKKAEKKNEDPPTPWGSKRELRDYLAAKGYSPKEIAAIIKKVQGGGGQQKPAPKKPPKKSKSPYPNLW